MNYVLNEDVMLNLRDGSWHISNPRMRTHVQLSSTAFKAFASLSEESISTEEFVGKFENGVAFDCTSRFIGKDGLVSDHSGYTTDKLDKKLIGKEILDLLIKRNILKREGETGLEDYCVMRNLFDQKSLGSFHQRVGQFIMMEKRSKEPWREWQNQKFSEDGKALLNTSYKKIQEPYFDKFFTREKFEGKTILDFGCGNGYYTSKLNRVGAKVVGLDNSAELLELAVKNFGSQENLTFKKTDTFDEVVELLNSWSEGSVHNIILQDTILLLIRPENTEEAPDLQKLLKAFRRVLGKEGKLLAMEPNPLFWLSYRTGNKQKPYAVITEYNNSVFNVAPVIDELLGHMSKEGFALESIDHPMPTDREDEQYNFHIEFPVWDFYTFRTF